MTVKERIKQLEHTDELNELKQQLCRIHTLARQALHNEMFKEHFLREIFNETQDYYKKVGNDGKVKLFAS